MFRQTNSTVLLYRWIKRGTVKVLTGLKRCYEQHNNINCKLINAP
uniref:Uncharacterized protein n=1 Tax=Anopheles minimus TaxID=112268 RepID=A0A182WQ42_9DIPT